MKNYEFKSPLRNFIYAIKYDFTKFLKLRNFIYAIKYDFTKFLKFTFQIYIYIY